MNTLKFLYAVLFAVAGVSMVTSVVTAEEVPRASLEVTDWAMSTPAIITALDAYDRGEDPASAFCEDFNTHIDELSCQTEIQVNAKGFISPEGDSFHQCVVTGTVFDGGAAYMELYLCN